MNQAEVNKSMACGRCDLPLEADHKFCPSCGWSVGTPYRRGLTGKDVVRIAAGGLMLWCAAMAVQWFAPVGKKPQEEFKQEQAATRGNVGTGTGHGESSDPEIVALRKAAEANPKDIEGWKRVAAAAGQKIAGSDSPTPDLIFEAIGAYRHILDIDPKQAEALLGMAEISFSQQAFSKSAEFYSKYLEMNPKDAYIRARYASSLTFLGKLEDSTAELKRALEDDPNNFHAMAYLAVNYAEMGDTKQALEIGEKVLQLAPSPEAKERFQQFLTSLKNNPKGAPVSTSAERGVASTPGSPPAVEAIVSSIKNNQVAGPKFAKEEFGQDGVLTLYFNAFPMEAMPPFVKTKFLGGVEEKIADPVKEVRFVDQASGKVMETVKKK